MGETEGERAYLALLREVMERGEDRPDRTGVGVRGVFGRQLRFDLSDGRCPVLTTKRVAWKTVIRELLWFLSGSTDSTVLERQGVNIWRGNTSRAFLDGRGLTHYREGDVGPLYPFALRHLGAPYAGCDADYSGQGLDQVTALIAGLRADPFSRRHLLTTYDPTAVPLCVLPPCHGLTVQFHCGVALRGCALRIGQRPIPILLDRPLADLAARLENENENENEKEKEKGEAEGTVYNLSCHVTCRSSDAFLGLPFNIASYGALTHLVAAWCGPQYRAHELIMSLGDVHVYASHMDAVREQIIREPHPPPRLRIAEGRYDQCGSCDDLPSLEAFELEGYVHHPAISAPMAV